MNKKITLSIIASAFIAGAVIFNVKGDEKVYSPRQASEEKVDGYLQYLNSIRANQFTGVVDDEDVKAVRSEIKKDAINKGLLYLFLGSISLFIGLASVFGNSRLIYFGSLLLGTAGILSAFGYFILAIKSSKTKH